MAWRRALAELTRLTWHTFAGLCAACCILPAGVHWTAALHEKHTVLGWLHLSTSLFFHVNSSQDLQGWTCRAGAQTSSAAKPLHTWGKKYATARRWATACSR